MLFGLIVWFSSEFYFVIALLIKCFFYFIRVLYFSKHSRYLKLRDHLLFNLKQLIEVEDYFVVIYLVLTQIKVIYSKLFFK